MKTCDLCGTPVEVKGGVTQHYEPIKITDTQVAQAALELKEKALKSSYGKMDLVRMGIRKGLELMGQKGRYK